MPTLPHSVTSLAFRAGRKAQFPWGLAVGAIVALAVLLVAYLFLTKPEVLPSELLFEKLFPPGSPVSQLETVNLDIDGVLQNPVFQKLHELGPVPIILPPLGKPNPFL